MKKEKKKLTEYNGIAINQIENAELNWKKRKEVEKLLEEVPEGKRIKLDKDQLEDLLFEKIYIAGRYLNHGKKTLIKFPVWSGPFLRKLDLSEVDFSDVAWGLYGKNNYLRKLHGFNEKDEPTNIPHYEIRDDSTASDMIITLEDENLKNAVENNTYAVDYSYTNAKIDLSKSFEAKNCYGNITVKDCNFEGCNFYPLYLENVSKYNTKINIENSNFANSGLRIISSEKNNVRCKALYEGIIKNFYEEKITYVGDYGRWHELVGYEKDRCIDNICIFNSNLENTNLSNLHIFYDDHGYIKNSNLNNTKANIYISSSEAIPKNSKLNSCKIYNSKKYQGNKVTDYSFTKDKLQELINNIGIDAVIEILSKLQNTDDSKEKSKEDQHSKKKR